MLKASTWALRKCTILSLELIWYKMSQYKLLPFSFYMKGGCISVETQLVPRYVAYLMSGFMNSLQLLNFSEHLYLPLSSVWVFQNCRILLYILTRSSLQPQETGIGIIFPIWQKIILNEVKRQIKFYHHLEILKTAFSWIQNAMFSIIPHILPRKKLWTLLN